MPTPSDEFERLIELSELELDYSNLQENLEDLTNLASKIVGADVSLVNLIDNYTQWSVANTGIDLQQMPRKESVCQYTIMGDDGLEINDLSEDERFNDKFYVKGENNFRYYFGVPLKTSNGYNIGALCILDSDSKDLAPEDKELMQLIANQVVRRLEALKKIQSLEEKIQQMNKKQREVRHDLRNPISGIIGLTQMMEEDIENEQINELKDLVKMVREGGNNLLEMVDEIMEFDEKKEKHSPKNEYSCETFCQKLRELYQPQAHAKGVTLEVETREASDNLNFSKARLLQIVGNLITNSIKFTDQGGKVEVRLTAEASSQSDANNLKIVVKDTGVGMTDEKIEEIKQGNAKSEGGTEGEKGYGFGLSLVQHLVNKAKGTMEIESEVGKGTTFHINIPI